LVLEIQMVQMVLMALGIPLAQVCQMSQEHHCLR
jgi:hypothetical protein